VQARAEHHGGEQDDQNDTETDEPTKNDHTPHLRESALEPERS